MIEIFWFMVGMNIGAGIGWYAYKKSDGNLGKIIKYLNNERESDVGKGDANVK